MNLRSEGWSCMGWNRDTMDPLITLMYDVYNMSPLRPIQEFADVGDLHVSEEKGRAKKRGRIFALLDPPLEMPPIRRDEALQDFDTVTSNSVFFKLGFDWFKGFLNALGIGGLTGKIDLAFNKKKAKWIKVGFSNVTKDSVDAFELGYRLEDTKLRVKNLMYQPGSKYYLVTAVARSPSMCIKAESEGGTTLTVDSEILKTIDGSAKAKTKQSTKEGLVVEGKKLAFAVEYYEMRYNPKLQRLSFIPAGIVRVGSEQKTQFKPSFIGGPKDDAFINLETT